MPQSHEQPKQCEAGSNEANETEHRNVTSKFTGDKIFSHVSKGDSIRYVKG